MSFSFNRVSFRHSNGKFALKDVTLKADTGEQIAIIGTSGSGKTSFLNVLATALKPSAGSVIVEGSDPWKISKARLKSLRSNIGLVHQSPPIPPRQRIITAILAGRLGKWPFWKSLISLIYPVDIETPRHYLKQLELGDRLFDRCDRLSGGQLQRVGVARVLYQSPSLILADEPVSAMDPVLSALTIRLLTEDAKARGATLVASLHAVDIALRWFPRIIGLQDGEVFFDLPAAEVTESLLKNLYSSETDILPQQNIQN